MKQYLFYSCSNKFEHGPLELLKSIHVRDDNTASGSEEKAANHEKHFKEYFAIGEYSALSVLVLNLDPASGITEVIRNEYAENPLKVRTIINPAAKKLAKKPLNTESFNWDAVVEEETP